MFYLRLHRRVLFIKGHRKLSGGSGVGGLARVGGLSCFALQGRRYLVQDVDVVVFGGEGGVVVAQPVHHGAAGDDDGCKQRADAVLKGWQLER